MQLKYDYTYAWVGTGASAHIYLIGNSMHQHFIMHFLLDVSIHAQRVAYLLGETVVFNTKSTIKLYKSILFVSKWNSTKNTHVKKSHKWHIIKIYDMLLMLHIERKVKNKS